MDKRRRPILALSLNPKLPVEQMSKWLIKMARRGRQAADEPGREYLSRLCSLGELTLLGWRGKQQTDAYFSIPNPSRASYTYPRRRPVKGWTERPTDRKVEGRDALGISEGTSEARGSLVRADDGWEGENGL